MTDEKLEKVKQIIENKKELEQCDLEVFADYLSKRYLPDFIRVEHIYTDDSFDMAYVMSPEYKLVINDKKFLEVQENSDILHVVFLFFKAFLHEFIHIRRDLTWQKNENEYINFTTEITLISAYCARKGFDFQKANEEWLLGEQEAELKSAKMMLAAIESGQFGFFNSKKFKAKLQKQVIRTRLLELIKPIKYLDRSYSLYDMGIIDIMTKIYMENPNLIKRLKPLGEIFNPGVDIVEMVFNYGENHFDLLRYLIVYLAEEELYSRTEDKISTLTEEERTKLLVVLDEIKQHEIKMKEDIEYHSKYIDSVVEAKNVEFFKNQVGTNIQSRQERIKCLEAFANFVNAKRISN